MSHYGKGKLIVTLHEGQDLSKKNVLKMDPFVDLELKGEKHKSEAHKGTHPKWDQSFIFNARGHKHNDLFRIHVFNKDILFTEKIGRADIPLRTFLKESAKPHGHWFQLVDFDNFEKITGCIRISTKIEGTDWPRLLEEEEAEEKEEKVITTTVMTTTPTYSDTSIYTDTITADSYSYSDDTSTTISYETQSTTYVQQPTPIIYDVQPTPILYDVQPTYTFVEPTPTYVQPTTYVEVETTTTYVEPVIITGGIIEEERW